MNTYLVDGVPMRAERRETTHTLLRSAEDKTRWVANELLHLLPLAEDAPFPPGQRVLLMGPGAKAYLAKLILRHRAFGAPTLIACVGAPYANKYGFSYGSAQYTDEQIEGFLKAKLVVAILWEAGVFNDPCCDVFHQRIWTGVCG